MLPTSQGCLGSAMFMGVEMFYTRPLVRILEMGTIKNLKLKNMSSKLMVLNKPPPRSHNNQTIKCEPETQVRVTMASCTSLSSDHLLACWWLRGLSQPQSSVFFVSPKKFLGKDQSWFQLYLQLGFHVPFPLKPSLWQSCSVDKMEKLEI